MMVDPAAEPPNGAMHDDVPEPTTDPGIGLSTAEVVRRRARHGPNEIEAEARPTLLRTIASAVSEPFLLLLFGAGALAILLGEVRDGLLVLLGLIPIIVADVATSYRAENALAALHDASAPQARARRDGTVSQIPAADLVPGDLVLIRSGDVIPADLRLTRVDGLLIDRSLLTGESVPELATLLPDPDETPLLSRRSQAFSGTAVVGGRGEGIVSTTGAATEIGRIAGRLAQTERRRSPLQAELDRLVRIMLVIATGLIAITVGSGMIRGQPAGANLLAGISAAIAAIPEEPPVLLAVILGLGAYRLLRKGVLVRRLSAQETLGAIDLIVTDKTGTLTDNRLALQAVLDEAGTPLHGPARTTILHTAICAEDDAWHLGTGVQPGSFTQALLAALDPGDDERPDPTDLVSAEPPADGHPYSETVCRRDGTETRLLLGAPEAVLERVGAGLGPWRDLIEREAAQGGRLVMLARASGASPLAPVAILVFADGLRPGVPDAMRTVTQAGIQTVVVTGDHPETARAIARAAQLDGDAVLLGSELAAHDDAWLAAHLHELRIVARAAPEDKLRIVDTARRLGRTVAVTGDGVNDAPALHHADVAVAMGSGTAVARDASDLVLGDDSFTTLIGALREGRRIVANVQKGLVFLLSTHVALLGFILIATLAGYDRPLLPIQILWLELFIDLSTATAFEREPEDVGIMTTRPRRRGEPLLSWPLLARITVAGSFSAVAALVLISLHGDGFDHVRWLAFTSLVIAQVVRAYGNRSLTRSVLSLPRNTMLALACVVVVAVQVVIAYVPPFADAFRATPLQPAEWLLVIAIALTPAVVADVGRRVTHGVWVG